MVQSCAGEIYRNQTDRQTDRQTDGHETGYTIVESLVPWYRRVHLVHLFDALRRVRPATSLTEVRPGGEPKKKFKCLLYYITHPDLSPRMRMLTGGSTLQRQLSDLSRKCFPTSILTPKSKGRLMWLYASASCSMEVRSGACGRTYFRDYAASITGAAESCAVLPWLTLFVTTFPPLTCSRNLGLTHWTPTTIVACCVGRDTFRVCP